MLTQWSQLGMHHLLPLPIAGWLSPERTSETLWPGAQKTFQGASGPLSLIVTALPPRAKIQGVTVPLSPQTSTAKSYDLFPAL